MVTPALWVILREISGLPKVAFGNEAKLIVVVGRVTACACRLAPKPISNARDKVNMRLREVFIYLD